MAAVVMVFVMGMVGATFVVGVRGVLIGLHVEPRAGIRLRVRRVEAPRRKEFGDIRRRPIDLVDFG